MKGVIAIPYKKNKQGLCRTKISTGRYDDDGKPIVIRLSAKSSAELSRKVREVKYEIEHGKKLSDENPCFGDYAMKWYSTYKANKGIRTQEMYLNLIKNHIRGLYDVKMQSLTKSDIQDAINDCIDHPRTCEQLKTMIHQICDCAVDDRVIPSNPCRKIELPRKIVKQKRALTHEETEAIKNANLPPFERAFLMTLYGTGMRPGEAYALTWQDIDFKNHTISVSKALQFTNSRLASVGYPKTNGSIRTIPMPNITESSLKAFYDNGGINYHPTIFGGSNGELRTRSAYKYIFDRCMAEAFHLSSSRDKAPITAYNFRHNYCTILIQSGVDLKTCQYLMGHNSSKMVMEVYAHIQTSTNISEKIKSLPL